MKKAFVCVFTEEDCNSLQKMQYRFLKQNGDIYIFINEDLGGLDGIAHVLSDTIAF